MHGAFEPNYKKEYEEAKEEAEMYAEAIIEAICKATELCPDCEEDMEWFAELAKYDHDLFKAEWDELIGQMTKTNNRHDEVRRRRAETGSGRSARAR